VAALNKETPSALLNEFSGFELTVTSWETNLGKRTLKRLPEIDCIKWISSSRICNEFAALFQRRK
jgi:hypothetical protein